MKYGIILAPQPEGGFTVSVPDLPGCVSQGETLDECRQNIADAIEGWLLTAQDQGWPLPEPKTSFEEIEVLPPKA